MAQNNILCAETINYFFSLYLRQFHLFYYIHIFSLFLQSKSKISIHFHLLLKVLFANPITRCQSDFLSKLNIYFKVRNIILKHIILLKWDTLLIKILSLKNINDSYFTVMKWTDCLERKSLNISQKNSVISGLRDSEI